VFIDSLSHSGVVVVGVICFDEAAQRLMRRCSIYGVYGISVFAVRDVTVDELAQQVPLVRFDRLSLVKVRDG